MTTVTTRYAVQYDASQPFYKWDVVDATGDVFESFETKAEAVRDARERSEEDEASELRESITERLEDLPLTALKTLAAQLNL